MNGRGGSRRPQRRGSGWGESMEFLNAIKILTVPTWVKWTIVLLVAFVGVTNATLFFVGLLDLHRLEWVKASIELMAVALPIFIVALLVTKSDAGERSLVQSTESVLTRVLPEVLSKVVEGNQSFFDPSRIKPSRRTDNLTKVLVSYSRGDCHSDYVLTVPWAARGGAENGDDRLKKLVLRVEINVYKVNIDLWIRRDLIQKAMGPTAAEGPAKSKAVRDYVFSRFAHSIAGAEHGQPRVEPAQNGESRAGADLHGTDGYKFNAGILSRQFDGRAYGVLVGTRHLPREFLWSAAEKLFFAQDLMLMLRSMLSEAPDLFETVEEPGARR